MELQESLTSLINQILPEGALESLEVSTDQFGQTVVNLQVKPEETGKLIGKEGRVIKSLRLLITAAYPNQKIVLNVNPLSQPGI